MSNLLIPNSTQVPNILLDLIFPVLKESERAVMLYICRRTFGFQRDADQISLHQFVEGLTSAEGYPLDFGCGVSHPHILQALRTLERMGLIERFPGRGRGHVTRYQLHLEPESEMVRKVTILQHTENARKEIGTFCDLFRKEVHKVPISPDKRVRIVQKKGTNCYHTKLSKKPSLEETKSLSSKPSVSDASVQDVIDGWNSICAGHGRLPRKLKPTESLKTKIRLRLKEHPEDEFWETVFNKCVDSPFLSGRSSKWRGATLDWLVENPNNAVKVYEGHYDEVPAQTE